LSSPHDEHAIEREEGARIILAVESGMGLSWNPALLYRMHTSPTQKAMSSRARCSTLVLLR
jgi:hypothetical protein